MLREKEGAVFVAHITYDCLMCCKVTGKRGEKGEKEGKTVTFDQKGEIRKRK